MKYPMTVYEMLMELVAGEDVDMFVPDNCEGFWGEHPIHFLRLYLAELHLGGMYVSQCLFL